MVGIIVVGNQATPAQIQKIFMALGPSASEAILISSNNPANTARPENFVSSSAMTLSSCMNQAVRQAKGSQLIIMDAQLNLDGSSLSRALNALAEESSSALAYLPLNSSGDTITFAELGVESLGDAIANQEVWPLCAVSTSRTLINQVSDWQGESTLEISARLMIQALSSGEIISPARASIDAASEASTRITQPDSGVRARCLAFVIDQCNIEELFPQHDWTRHQGESAAAAYHKLAAMFIRLGDSDSAQRCLDLSDQFEDSPRSLALKAMIALTKGETLAAVANMVSSLQQYELRKRSDGSHYLSFEPNNLEVINTNLSAGLEALNKRENEQALEFFAEAIFSFDSLYSEFGVTNIRSMMQ